MSVIRLNRPISVAPLSPCSFFAFVDVYLVVVTFRDIAGREAVATNTERFDDGINRPQKEQCECNQYGNRWPSERHVGYGTHRKSFGFRRRSCLMFSPRLAVEASILRLQQLTQPTFTATEEHMSHSDVIAHVQYRVRRAFASLQYQSVMKFGSLLLSRAVLITSRRRLIGTTKIPH